MIATVALAILMPVLFIVFQEPYLQALGTSGDILHYAEEYYLFLPLNTAIMIISVYLEQMVYSDGDVRRGCTGHSNCQPDSDRSFTVYAEDLTRKTFI